MTNGKIAVAVAGGYLLGRTKKMKLALGLGMLLAGKKITLDPQQLARAVADSPLLSGLNAQARKELSGAAKSAATSALSTRMNGLADSLHERTLSLRGEADDERDERDERDADEEPEDDEPADEASERKPPAPRRRAPQAKAKAAKAPVGRARKAATSSPGAAKKTAKKTAKKAAKKTAGGRNG